VLSLSKHTPPYDRLLCPSGCKANGNLILHKAESIAKKFADSYDKIHYQFNDIGNIDMTIKPSKAMNNAENEESLTPINPPPQPKRQIYPEVNPGS